MERKIIGGAIEVMGDATIGASATVRGAAKIGGDLKVEGRIHGDLASPNKGLYPSLTELESAHPHPEQGWWALIGEADTAGWTIAQVNESGSWYDTLQEYQGEQIDVAPINDAIAAKELAGMSASATDNGVTLTVSNAGGHSVSAQLPVATTEAAGLMSAADKSNLETADRNAHEAYVEAGEVRRIANTALETVNTAKETADAALRMGSAAITGIGRINENLDAALTAATNAAGDASTALDTATDALNKIKAAKTAADNAKIAARQAQSAAEGVADDLTALEDGKVDVALQRLNSIETNTNRLESRISDNTYKLREHTEKIANFHAKIEQAYICKGMVRVNSVPGNVYKNSTGSIIVEVVKHELDKHGHRLHPDDYIFSVNMRQLLRCLGKRNMAELDGEFWAVPLKRGLHLDTVITMEKVEVTYDTIRFQPMSILDEGYVLAYRFDASKNPFAEGNGYCMLSESGMLRRSRFPWGRSKRKLTPPTAEEVYRTLYWGANPPIGYPPGESMTMKCSLQVQRVKWRTHKMVWVDGDARWVKLKRPYKQWTWITRVKKLLWSESDENVKVRCRRKTRTGVSEWAYFILHGNVNELKGVRTAGETNVKSTMKAYPGDPGTHPTWQPSMMGRR